MTLHAGFLVDQLRAHLEQTAATAKRAELDAREAARTVATASEKREDGRVALEFGSLATGQSQRAREASEQLAALDAFRQHGLPTYSRDTPIGLGAIVDVATEDADGTWERTFILLPVGAATELEGPGGDGFITVITPASPVGRALMDKRVGDVADVTIKGEPYEWEILDIS